MEPGQHHRGLGLGQECNAIDPALADRGRPGRRQGLRDRAEGVGLCLGCGVVGSAALGGVAEATSIEYVFWLCSFLPFAGLLTVFLPNMEKGRAR